MRILTTAFLCLIILSAGVGGYLLFGNPPEVVQHQNTSQTTPLVRTAVITGHTQPVVIETDGDANALRLITVAAQVSGQIEHRSHSARSGMLVQEGDLLFQIDDTNYRLELERLEAQLSLTNEESRSVEIDIVNTEELIQLAEQDAALRKKQLERIEDAYARKSTSESEVDEATRQETTARNSLQTLLNSKRSMRQMLRQKTAGRKLVTAQLKKAQVDIERCIITAPTSGRIVDDIAEQGDYIRDGDELVHISDSSCIEVRCSLEADDLVWILQKASELADSAADVLQDPLATPIPCEVIYDFEGTEVLWNGILSRFEGTGINRQTRTFPCRVTVTKPHQYCIDERQAEQVTIAPSLSAGMFVTVRIPIQDSRKLLSIPITAVRPGSEVWVVNDGILRIKSVAIAHSSDEYILLRATQTDLTENDQVVISPLVSAKDGMAVRRENQL